MTVVDNKHTITDIFKCYKWFPWAKQEVACSVLATYETLHCLLPQCEELPDSEEL
jgi:hypothetical protein